MFNILHNYVRYTQNWQNSFISTNFSSIWETGEIINFLLAHILYMNVSSQCSYTFDGIPLQSWYVQRVLERPIARWLNPHPYLQDFRKPNSWSGVVNTYAMPIVT